MKSEWFEEVILSWSDAIQWSSANLKEASQLLASISKINGGIIVETEDLLEADIQAYAVERAINALERRTNRYASALRKHIKTPYYTSALREETNPSLPFLEYHHWQPAINLNTSNIDELEALPGIGAKLARRIITHRLAHEPYKNFDDLDQVRGFGSSILAQIREKVYFGETPTSLYLNHNLLEFAYTPSFSKYVQLIAEIGGSFGFFSQKEMSPERQVIRELTETLEEIELIPYGKLKNLPVTRGKAVKTQKNYRARADEIKKNSVTLVQAGTLLYDKTYLGFVKQLLGTAKKSIDIVMFFLRSLEEEKHPSDTLVEELISAHRRGVAVRVILDKDAEGDVYLSRIINKPVFEKLRNNGIPVRNDKKEQLMHSKVVLVDGRHTILGSHNWTAGSFFIYDDTSIYFESEEFAAAFQQMFEALWVAFESI